MVSKPVQRVTVVAMLRPWDCIALDIELKLFCNGKLLTESVGRGKVMLPLVMLQVQYLHRSQSSRYAYCRSREQTAHTTAALRLTVSLWCAKLCATVGRPTSFTLPAHECKFGVYFVMCPAGMCQKRCQ